MAAARPSKLETGMNMLPGGRAAAPLVGAALAAGGAAVFAESFSGWKSVQEGTVAVRTRFKKVRYNDDGSAKIAYPGMRFGMFILNPLFPISVQDRSQRLGVFPFEAKDAQLQVDASVIWHVVPELADRAIFKTDTLHETVQDFCQNGIRNALGALKQANIHPDDVPPPELAERLFTGMSDTASGPLYDDYGVRVKRLILGPIARSQGQMIIDAMSGPQSTSNLFGPEVTDERQKLVIASRVNGDAAHAGLILGQH